MLMIMLLMMMMMTKRYCCQVFRVWSFEVSGLNGCRGRALKIMNRVAMAYDKDIQDFSNVLEHVILELPPYGLPIGHEFLLSPTNSDSYIT